MPHNEKRQLQQQLKQCQVAQLYVTSNLMK